MVLAVWKSSADLRVSVMWACGCPVGVVPHHTQIRCLEPRSLVRIQQLASLARIDMSCVKQAPESAEIGLAGVHLLEKTGAGTWGRQQVRQNM